MHDKIGIVWNPSKIEEDTLREAIDRATEQALGGAPKPAPKPGPTPKRQTTTPPPEILWFSTAKDDPGREATTQALDAGCTVVVAAGGDGTVRAVAERLGESGTPAAELGILPLGTGNLLARNLDVPLGDPQKAFERVLTGKAAPIDLGEAELTLADGTSQRVGFVVMVGFGIDAQMIVETDDDLKAKAGWLAYVESLGRAMNSTEVTDLTLAIDGGKAEAQQAHTLLIGNCGTVQGGLALLPDAQPDDGELDLLILGASNVGGWLDTMRNMVWDNGVKRFISGGGSAESSESAQHLRAREAVIELPKPHLVEVDGDEVGEVSEVRVRVLPAALRVR